MLFVRYRLLKKEVINIIVKKGLVGDWYLLYILGQNIENVLFREIVTELAQKLGYHDKNVYNT